MNMSHTWEHDVDGPSWLPVERILWAPTNSAHGNHLHVVGLPRMAQSAMPTNGIWTSAIGQIFDALDAEFGAGEHFIIDPDAAWTHMGVYNPRFIGGTTTWSQHAGANAIDIGPYYGVEEQKVFYDFLTRKAGEEEGEDDMPLTEAEMDQIAEKAARAVWTYMIRDFPSDSQLHTNTVLRAIRNDVYSIEQIVKNLDANDGATAEEIADEIAARLVD